MSNTKTIFISILISVILNSFITIGLNLHDKKTNSSKVVSDALLKESTSVMNNPLSLQANEVLENNSSDKLDTELNSLAKRTQEIYGEMGKYEFSDPKHKVLLQELNNITNRISEINEVRNN